MRSSFKIAKIANIPIEINLSWFIAFGLVLFTLAKLQFPMIVPYLTITEYWAMSIITTILLFTSLLTHELAHSIVAQRNNLPIKSITLFIFGGVAQMEKEPSSPGVELRMAAAGPITSIVLALLFSTIGTLLTITHARAGIAEVAYTLAVFNTMVAIFNMVPGFPLDGGRIFRALLWMALKDIKKATHIATLFGKGFAFILMIIGITQLLRGAILPGLWLAFIGLFLEEAADISYKQVIMRKSLQGVRIKDIMSKDVATVVPTLFLREMIDNFFFKFRYHSFPVIESDNVIGIISLHDIKEIPKAKWENTTVKETMKPITDGMIINEHADAIGALTQMAKHKHGRLLVIENQKLVGIVSQRDITRLFHIKSDLED